MTMYDIAMCNKLTLLPSVSCQTGLRMLFNETNHVIFTFKFPGAQGF